MIIVLLIVGIVLLCSTSFGIILNKKINFNNDDFLTPIGFAGLIAILQLIYYPAQLFNLSSNYLHITTAIVLILLIALGVKNFKEIIKEYLNIRTVFIAVSFVVFFFVFYHCYIDIEYSDSQMYLNYMAQNIDIKHINMFNLWTGKVGKEWDTIYMFQGFYHFGSCLAYFANLPHYLLGKLILVENITVFTWCLGMLYSLMSSMLIYNFIHYLKLNRIYEYSLLSFGLLYLNFFYWRVALSFYGNTFRTIYMCALIFYLMRYFKENRKDFKWIAVIIGFAGIAFSSSFLFISFSIMYALMVYMFKKMEKGSIAEMADFVLPILIYALACFSKDNFTLFIIGGTLAICYFLLRDNYKVIKITDSIELFLHKNYRFFIYGVFVILAISSFVYLKFINPHYEYNYAHYFQKHSGYDMLQDFFFNDTSIAQNTVDIIRWLGVALILINKENDEGTAFLKNLLVVLFVVFLNPLVTPMIARLIASNVYYRTFDVVFNPLTELVFMVLIIRKLEDLKWNNKIIQIGLFTYVFGMILYAHSFSYMNHYSGEYGFYTNRDIIPKYKIDYFTYDVIKNFQEIIKDSKDPEIRVVSHADGLRVFEPEVYQIFTAREEYYPQDRVDEEFFQQARNRHSYGYYEYFYFANVCDHIKEFEVDYVISSWFNNMDFDIEISKQGTLLYENDVFRVYKFDYE